MADPVGRPRSGSARKVRLPGAKPISDDSVLVPSGSVRVSPSMHSSQRSASWQGGAARIIHHPCFLAGSAHAGSDMDEHEGCHPGIGTLILLSRENLSLMMKPTLPPPGPVAFQPAGGHERSGS